MQFLEKCSGNHLLLNIVKPPMTINNYCKMQLNKSMTITRNADAVKIMNKYNCSTAWKHKTFQHLMHNMNAVMHNVYIVLLLAGNKCDRL